MKKYHIKLKFTQPLLGTVAKDPTIYETFIANHAAVTDEAKAEELATVEKVEERGWTGFHKLNGGPILYDYAIKGFFKDACSMLSRVGEGTESAKLRAFKKVIDGLVFVEPRQIPLILPDGDGLGVMERPLRGQTAQGERISLARSDTCPAGTVVEFDVTIMGAVSEKLLIEWLNYGRFRGLGQWRNAGWGAFTYEMSEAVA